MASLYPARAMRLESTHGHLHRGARADFAILADDLTPISTWIAGQQVFGS